MLSNTLSRIGYEEWFSNKKSENSAMVGLPAKISAKFQESRTHRKRRCPKIFIIEAIG
jgi:hypothetical protein